jgi:small subunit ribosomal protein S15
MLDRDTKQKVINKFKVHATDTGSSQVQIAILTEEIKRLTDHLKSHKHDHSSRRGLLKKVSERRKLLKFLQKESQEAFNELAKKLKLKIAKKMIEDEEEERRRLEEEMTPKVEAEEETVEEAGEESKKEE